MIYLAKEKKVPMRMCLGCREMKPKRELIRIVMNKDGEISLDFTGKLPGRGAYICNSAECVKKLKKSHGIERNYGCSVQPEIYDSIERKLSENE